MPGILLKSFIFCSKVFLSAAKVILTYTLITFDSAVFFPDIRNFVKITLNLYFFMTPRPKKDWVYNLCFQKRPIKCHIVVYTAICMPNFMDTLYTTDFNVL